jgi:hypothetical protein
MKVVETDNGMLVQMARMEGFRGELTTKGKTSSPFQKASASSAFFQFSAVRRCDEE